MKKWIILVVLLVAAAAVGLAIFYRSGPAEASNTLITAQVTRGDVVETVQATGTLEAVTTVQVGTQVSGTIKALHADFNSRVRQGQVVAELEPSLFETQVEQARATLVRLQAELERAKVQVEDSEIKLKRARELSARQLIPASELETAESNARQTQAAMKSAEAQIVQARASLNQSQVNLGHTIIKAPIDGIVVSRNVDVGQTVAASMQAPTLFVIARDLTEMQVSASIDESDIGRIRPGQKVSFRVDAYPDDTFAGTVQQVRLQPVVQQNVVSYTTIIDVPNRELKLKPGMTATVTVEIARANDVLRVPTAALRFRPTAEVFASLNQEPPPAFAEASAGRPGVGAASAGRPGVGAASAGKPPFAEGTAGVDAQASAKAGGGDQDATRGSGGGPFAKMTPEERQQMRERMQQASPEERRQMRRQFGERLGEDRDRTSAAAPAPAEAPKAIVRPIWVLTNGKLERVAVRVSINDGAMTAVLDGPFQPGAQVVTGVTQPQSASQGAANPLMPFGGRFPGARGGFVGGGGGARGSAGGARGGSGR